MSRAEGLGLVIEVATTGDTVTSSRIDAVQWRDDGILAFKYGDGHVLGLPAPEDLGFEQMGMSVVEYRPWVRRLLFFRTNGFGYTFEVGSFRNWSPIRERPVVYLDQNQWSTLSKAWSAPHRVRSGEHAAAVALLKLCESGKVILPMSAAHLSETAAWSNDEGRIALADTILFGSSGWQMRDPLEVRAAELRAVLSASVELHGETMTDVFTLAPYAALDVSTRTDTSNPLPQGIPDECVDVHRALLSSIVYTSCMLNREPTPRGDLSSWVTRVQEFATWLSGETGRTKHEKRRSAYVFAFSDVMKEVAQASFSVGVSPEQMSTWSRSTWHKAWTDAPGVSHFREAMVDKLVAGAKWEANDLTDLMYLCTAAAYADHVVGERRTIALLRQATRRLQSPVRLHTNLVSLVESLQLPN